MTEAAGTPADDPRAHPELQHPALPHGSGEDPAGPPETGPDPASGTGPQGGSRTAPSDHYEPL